MVGEWNMGMEHWRNDAGKGKSKYLEKSMLSAILSTRNPMWFGLWLNLCSEKLATNHRSCGMATRMSKKIWTIFICMCDHVLIMQISDGFINCIVIVMLTKINSFLTYMVLFILQIVTWDCITLLKENFNFWRQFRHVMWAGVSWIQHLVQMEITLFTQAGQNVVSFVHVQWWVVNAICFVECKG
jgi:hypothetical protein